MKRHFLFFLLTISFSISLMLLNCSKEISISGPNDQEVNKFLAKVTIGKLDHSKDTVITLTKSNKTIIIKKKLEKTNYN